MKTTKKPALAKMTAAEIINHVKRTANVTITGNLKNKKSILKKAEAVFAKIKEAVKEKTKLKGNIPTTVSLTKKQLRKNHPTLVEFEINGAKTLGLVYPSEPKVTLKKNFITTDKTIVHVVDENLAPIMHKGQSKKILMIESKFTVAAQEKQPKIARTKRTPGGPSNKDFSKYVFQSKTYNKGRLFLAVIAKYAEDHNPTLVDLKRAFPDEVIRPFGKGLFLPVEQAKKINEDSKRSRFFLDTLVQINGSKIAVTNQVNVELLERFLPVVQKHNYTITKQH